MKLKSLIALATGCGLWLLNSTGFAQGSLTPPGPPGPTMLTLSQIEPRTPIATNTTPGDASDLYVIRQPGSYYLTANLIQVTNLNGIEILANNVTLDFRGFTLLGHPGTSFETDNGIIIPDSVTNIMVRNGNIDGWTQGVYSEDDLSANLVFEDLNVANCYSGPNYADSGLALTGPATVRNCTFANDEYAVSCDYLSATSGSLIVGCTINDCVAGITLGGCGLISGCTANNCSYCGFEADANIYAPAFETGIVISDCAAYGDYFGMLVEGSRNRIENNHVTSMAGGTAGNGIYVYGGTNNIVIRNSVQGYAGNNYYISGTQITGAIITATGTVTNNNPWANFSY